jgi:hypothetical protein
MEASAGVYGWAVLAQVKMMVSRLSGWITFLAASSCLDAMQSFSDSSQPDVIGHELRGGVPGKGGDVRKESFIANLVANMTIPELGEKFYLETSRSRKLEVP